MNSDASEIVRQIKAYKQQLNQMDNRVLRYLKDRQSNPHPDHEAFIDKVRKYERKVHGYPSTDVQFWLDNLMSSLLFYERYWKRLFDRSHRRGRRQVGGGGGGDVDLIKKMVDRIYTMEQQKWAERNVSGRETKADLRDRVLPDYVEAKKQQGRNQKIVWVYDKKSDLVEFRVKTMPER